MSAFAYDVRFALRSLRAAPGFTLTAILILALGIGTMTAIVSLVDHVLLSPLPYPEPHRLVMVWDVLRDQPGEHGVVAPGNIADWREQTTTIDSLAVFNLSSLTLDHDDGRERVSGAAVTGNYFDVLGVRPRFGRGLTEADEAPEAAPAIVLSHGFWRRRFGADPAILGRAVRVENHALTIVGVMPADFRGVDEHYFGPADYWIPLRVRLREGGRGGHYLRTVGRLKPGATLEQARDELRRIADRSSAQYPATNARWTTAVVPLQEALVSGVKPALLMLLAAVALVHLTVCANFANLLLSRNVTREREYAIRAAVGASRVRLIQTITAESIVLTFVGSVAGLVVAAWLLRAATALIPNLPATATIQLDARAAAFAAALALATSLGAGLLPAFKAAGVHPSRALQAGGRGAGPARQRVRRLLVISEIAGSVVLFIAALLLARSFDRLASVPTGFSTAGVVAARVELPRAIEAPLESNRREAAALADRIGALPGVEHAGFTTSLPLFGLNNVGLAVDTTTRRDGDRKLTVRYRAVTPGYLRAIQADLIAGRLLEQSDGRDAPGAVVINDVAARVYGDDDPIGAPIRVDFGQPFTGTVVGVIQGVRHDDLAVTPEAEMYVPYAQHPVMGTVFLAARTAGPLPSADALRTAVRSASPRATLDEVTPLKALVDRSVAPQRLNALLLTGLSVAALTLAVVGLYAVIAHGAAQRVREFGIRLALGAQAPQIRSLVLGDGLMLAFAGVAIGSIAAYFASRMLQGLLFGITPHDAPTFAIAAVVMVLVASCASYLPARRASRVDPIVSLRME